MIIETLEDYANVIIEPDDIHNNALVITREEKGDFFSPLKTQRLYICENVQTAVRLLATLASYRFKEISDDNGGASENSEHGDESPVRLLRIFALKSKEIEKKYNNEISPELLRDFHRLILEAGKRIIFSDTYSLAWVKVNLVGTLGWYLRNPDNQEIIQSILQSYAEEHPEINPGLKKRINNPGAIYPNEKNIIALAVNLYNQGYYTILHTTDDIEDIDIEPEELPDNDEPEVSKTENQK